MTPRTPLLIILTAGIMLSHLPMILGTSSRFVRNTDEVQMTLATTDRLLGTPYVHSAWPAGTLQLLTLPVIAVDYWASTPHAFNLDALAKYLSNVYREPWHVLRLQKLIVAVVSSLGVVFFAFGLSRYYQRPGAGFFGLLILSTIPVFWTYSEMATADAVSVACICAALWVGATNQGSAANWLAVGGLFGLALAAKLTAIFAAPFLVGVCWRPSARWLVRGLALGVLGAIIGFGFACPYAWIEPLRFLKSVAGNSLREGIPLGLPRAATYIAKQIGWPIILATCAGAWHAIAGRRWSLLLGTAGSVVACIVVVARAGVVYDRYMLALVVPLGMLAASGCQWIADELQRHLLARFAWKPHVCYAAVAVLFCAPNVLHYHSTAVRQLAAFAGNESAIAEGLTNPNGGTVFAPFNTYMLCRLGSQMDASDLKQMTDGVQDNPSHILAMFPKQSFKQPALEVLGGNMTTWEQVLRARLSAMAAFAKPSGKRVVFWASPSVALRFGLRTREEAWESFESSENAAFIDVGNADEPNSSERASLEYKCITKAPEHK